MMFVCGGEANNFDLSLSIWKSVHQESQASRRGDYCRICVQGHQPNRDTVRVTRDRDCRCILA